MFHLMNLLTGGVAVSSIALAAMFGGNSAASTASPCECCAVCVCENCQCTERGCSCDVGGDCLCDAACCETGSCCEQATACAAGCCTAK